MNRKHLAPFLLLLLAALFVPQNATAQKGGKELLRLMSYNVRYPAEGDGPNLWDLRKELFIASIRAADPDLFGTQELFYLQGQYIQEKLPQYAWFGLSRRGNKEDEHMGIFYKTAKLKLLQQGNFWLSETPDVPGSSAWNMSLPRMVTWGLFQSKATGRKFYHYNTHFAHRAQDEPARIASAKLILSRIAKLPKDLPLLLTGDFNTGADSQPHQLFAAELTDAWTASPIRFGPEGTFNGFKGTTTGPRIDWIFFRPAERTQLRALQTSALDMHFAGRYPSDHFPILSLLEFE